VAESEAKVDASACHPLVGAKATSTLMTRCLILAICSTNLSRTLFHKLSTHEAVKKSSTKNYQSTPYSSPHRISTSTNTTHTITTEGRRVYVSKTGRGRGRKTQNRATPPDWSGHASAKNPNSLCTQNRSGSGQKNAEQGDWSGQASAKNPNRPWGHAT
jgi:hypothetical protein